MICEIWNILAQQSFTIYFTFREDLYRNCARFSEAGWSCKKKKTRKCSGAPPNWIAPSEMGYWGDNYVRDIWRGIVHDGVPGIRRLIVSYLMHKNAATRLSLREFAAYAISHSGTYTIHERTAEEEQAAVVRSEFVRKVNEGLRVINLVDVWTKI